MEGIMPVETYPNAAAFPTPNGTARPGLTKREYYAGLLMQGILASGGGSSAELEARFAVQAADALIAQLNKEPGQ
jgi:hypothetical protein